MTKRFTKDHGESLKKHIGSLCGPTECKCPCVDCSQFGICSPRTDEPVPTDAVNHPAHYTFGTIEVIDVLEDWQLPFHLANVVQYVARAGRKDRATELQDLEKAQWYLERYIKLREKQVEGGNDDR